MKTIIVNGNRIITAGRYYSKTFETENHFKSGITQAVINYKQGAFSITSYINQVLKNIGTDFQPVLIPSHNGINNKVLVRYKEIKKLQFGGNRNKTTHLKSIEVISPPKKILLIDDVVTSGGSFTACVEMLKKCNCELVLFSIAYAKKFEIKGVTQ